MKFSFIRVVGLCALLTLFNCTAEKKVAKSSNTSEASAIVTINTHSTSIEDFKYIYNKNNANTEDAYTKESLENYMDMYVKFKLKVEEAKSLGIDTTSEFKGELAGYRKQLAAPYLNEKKVTDSLIKEAYQRMKEEVRASHILILCDKDASPKDTLIAYNKIKLIRERATKAENFGLLAKEYSEDPSAITNNGDLGYFTALRMVYEFENAAYNTPVNGVSKIVRTKFGYHILKVTGRRPSQGDIQVAHILIRYTSGMSVEDSIQAKSKVDEIYKSLQIGESWNELCLEFSEDVNSRAKGGELSWFTTGRMYPTFENAAFNLKSKGEYCAPIQTPYGWHIIKLIDKKPLGTFEELQPSIRAKVTKDSRSDLNRKVLLARLRKENHLVENDKALKFALLKADSSLLLGYWTFMQNEKYNTTLFSIEKEPFSIAGFYTYVNKNQKAVSNYTPVEYMNKLYTDYVNESLISYEESHLEQKYYDFKMLYQEYYDGILLFDRMETNVWNKSLQDTVGLNKFFKENQSKYTWQDRANATIVSASSKDILHAFVKDLQKPYSTVEELTFPKLFYDASKANVSNTSKEVLNKVITQLKKDNNQIVKFYVSKEKSESLKVLNARIDSLRKYLIQNKIDMHQMIFVTEANKPQRKYEIEKKEDRSASISIVTTSLKYLENTYNKKMPLAIQLTEGKFQKVDNDVFNKIEWQVDSTEFEMNGRYYFVKIKEIEPARNKNLNECKGLVISDYQLYLEKNWIEELRKKYPIIINQEALQSLVKK
jgi:peptidyl-prolyl cis-trans isomerase SurA